MHTFAIVLLYSTILGTLTWLTDCHDDSRQHSRHLAQVPFFSSGESLPCFLIGNKDLPEDLRDQAAALAESITCDFSRITIDHVPDVSTSTRSFSNINFRSSSTTPLRFALEQFATKSPLSSSSLRIFEQRRDLYIATEAGLRSEGGNLDIVVVRKFLELQVARIKRAQGIEISDRKQTPEYLLGEVSRSVTGDDLQLLGEVMALGTQFV